MTAYGVLRDPRQERFCQAIVAGKTKAEAYAEAGYKGKNHHAGALNLMRHDAIKKRLDELFTRAATRAELSRKDILERILDDWNNSRKLGQMASALKAAELLGRELHHMFTERKEIGRAGDFDQKSEDELRKIVIEGMEELGWKDLPKGDSTLN